MRKATTFMVTALLMAVAIPAQADQPVRFLPAQETEISFVDDRCGFDMLVELSGKEGRIVFEDYERGIFPMTRGVVTNLETGESHSFNAAGPGRVSVTPNPEGGFTIVAIGTGNWVHGHGDDMFLTSGRFVETVVIDAEFNLVSENLDYNTARVVSLCELLGPETG
jgi:hypothetical protein